MKKVRIRVVKFVFFDHNGIGENVVTEKAKGIGKYIKQYSEYIDCELDVDRAFALAVLKPIQ